VTSGNHKKGCKWLFTSHENIKEDDLLNSIDPMEGNNILKYEPLILHVQCRTLESAKLMVSVDNSKFLSVLKCKITAHTTQQEE
jgi:tRNA wybutosine-synthesizing protein 3